MTARTEKVFFSNSRGARLSGRIYSAEGGENKGVIFCHGLFSTKDGYKITRMAESLVDAGFRVLAFDFSYAGESEGSIAEISLIQCVRDIAGAAEFFRGRGVSEIHLMGSSMGAAAAILFCAGQKPSPVSLISIAAPLDLTGLLTGNSPISDPLDLPENGQTLLEGFLINNSFFREIAAIDMKAAVRAIDCPVLLIHGKLDTVVPFANALEFASALKTPFRALYIEDGDHNLTRDRDIERLRTEVSGWIRGGYAC